MPSILVERVERLPSTQRTPSEVTAYHRAWIRVAPLNALRGSLLGSNMQRRRRKCMSLSVRKPMVQIVAAITVVCTFALDSAQAQDKNYVMKISLPTINDPSHHFAKNY